MKIWLTLFIVTFLGTDISQVRKSYPTASANEKNAQAFHELVSRANTDDAVMQAYKGAAETLLSKFARKVGEKISHMKAGADLIDDAVSRDPDNIEIRMVRLSVQENVPRIVNYRKNRDEDKAAILAQYEKSGPVKEYIRQFILRSDSFTQEEKNAFK